MKLNEIEIGQTVEVVCMDLSKHMEQRLLALGMTLHTQVTVLQKKRNGTLVIDLRGTRFALGKDITKKIEVTK